MTRDELIIKEEKKKNNKTLEKLIQNGFENFLKKTKNYEFYLLHLIRIFSNLLGDFKEFKEDYTYYIYNNLRVLIFSKELNEALKAVTYKNENEKYYKEFLKFTTERWNIFERAAKNYKIELFDVLFEFLPFVLLLLVFVVSFTSDEFIGIFELLFSAIFTLFIIF